MSTTPLLSGGAPSRRNQYGTGLPSPPPSPRFPPSSSSQHSISSLWRGYATAEQLSACSPAVRGFYHAQNEQLRAFREAFAGKTGLTRDEERFLAETSACSASEAEEEAAVDGEVLRDMEGEERYTQRAVVVSNVFNFVLIFAQAFVFWSTGSMAMLAVLVDAGLDCIAGLVILATYLMRKRKRDVAKYPVGRTRLEPLGIILVACLMTASTLSAIKEAMGVLFAGITGIKETVVSISLLSFCVLGLAIVSKAALYIYCRASTDASVEALAMDHWNDILASSTAIATILVTEHVPGAWWLDPLGGIVISLLIIKNWSMVTQEHCDKLLSRTADRVLLNQIVYIALIHSPANIRKIDTVRGYHVGPGIFVECDIVLDPDVPLMYAHDIGESLQRRVELLDDVERCFVHLDTESEHSPSYEHKDIL